ncbi:MAG: DUF507 family protein [Deltaproteobacteria bacterium]|nr:DUF507 family protein [Deltaproteobacteria bacterium]MBI3295522.1 DUF507 family protein [Deltaproteobacteria bacterium]
MRLQEPQVKHLCQKLLLTLRSNQLITLRVGEADILKRMVEIFMSNLRAEDDLNREVEKLMQQYAAKMGASFDKEKMFQMIKKQLIKDKGIII